MRCLVRQDKRMSSSARPSPSTRRTLHIPLIVLQGHVTGRDGLAPEGGVGCRVDETASTVATCLVFVLRHPNVAHRLVQPARQREGVLLLQHGIIGDIGGTRVSELVGSGKSLINAIVDG